MLSERQEALMASSKNARRLSRNYSKRFNTEKKLEDNRLEILMELERVRQAAISTEERLYSSPRILK